MFAMTMTPRMLHVLAVLGILAAALGQLQDDQEVKRDRRFVSNLARRFLGGRSCGPPDACPPHHCRLDDAVLHGYCCGCAVPGDRVPLPCPPGLRCPLSPYPLCDDYNFMMDCCC